MTKYSRIQYTVYYLTNIYQCIFLLYIFNSISLLHSLPHLLPTIPPKTGTAKAFTEMTQPVAE